MNSNYLQSLEGYNFDKLAFNVRKWNQVKQRHLYISEMFNHRGLIIQLVKSYDRVVGMIDYVQGQTPILITLGNWSTTTAKQLTQYSNEKMMIKVSGDLLSVEAINRLQEGLV